MALIGVKKLTVPSSGASPFPIDQSAVFGATIPVAGLFVGSRHPNSADPGTSVHGNGAWGLSDGTTNLSGSWVAGDALTQTITRSIARSDRCLTMIHGSSGTEQYGASSCSFVAGGAELSFAVANSTPYQFGAMLFGGAGVQAKVGKTGSLSLGAGSITGIGFEADTLILLMATCANAAFGAGLGLDVYWMLGACSNDGIPTQRVIDYFSNNAQFIGERSYSFIASDSAILARNGAGLLTGTNLQITGFTSDGFAYYNGGSYTQEFAYLALKNIHCKVYNLTIPDSIGEVSDTEPGFTPLGLLSVASSHTAVDVDEVDNAKSSGHGIGLCDAAGNQVAISWAVRASADPTDIEHDCKAHAIYSGIDGPDAQAIAADFVSMDAQGYTVDYTSTDTIEHLGVMVAFGGAEQTGESGSGSGSGGEGSFEDTVWEVVFNATASGWIACAAPVSGGPGLAGVEDVEETGNGFWKVTLDNIPIRTRAEALYYREIEAKLTGRIGVALLIVCDGKYAPWPEDMSTIEAYAKEAMAVGATSGEIEMINGSTPRAGMQWSTGQRTYRIETVGAVQSGDTYPITFWPKVREAIEAGAELDFVNLKLRSRLETPDAMHLALEVLRFGSPSLTFVEDVLP